jgi:hypothetical protein
MNVEMQRITTEATSHGSQCGGESGDDIRGLEEMLVSSLKSFQEDFV